MASSPFGPAGATKTPADAELEAGFPSLAQAGFDVVAPAGSGGMGVVYQAVHRETGGTVALKLVSSAEGNVERFALECDVLSELEHPNIVGHVAHGVTASGQPFLAMEWLDGETLSQRLSKGPLSVADCVSLASQLCDALMAAHAKAIVHRDLKPSNIFLLQGSEVALRSKILDFGVARLREGHRDLTLTNQIVGTPGYMAPEQARGVRDVDARADLFSLGCVLFHAVTGVAPFEGSDVLTVLAKLANEQPPPVGELQDDVPEPLELLIVSLLDKDPAGRPESASVVSHELMRIAEVIETSPEFRRLRGTSARQGQLDCVVLARPPESSVEAVLTDELQMDVTLLQREIAEAGGVLQVLGGRALLVRIPGQESATARANSAARCADLIARSHPSFRVSVASHLTGSGVGPQGQRRHPGVIDSATRTLVGASPGKVRVAQPLGDSEALFLQHVLRAIETTGTPFELAPTVAGPLIAGEAALSPQTRRPSHTQSRLLVGLAVAGLLLGATALGVSLFGRSSQPAGGETPELTKASEAQAPESPGTVRSAVSSAAPVSPSTAASSAPTSAENSASAESSAFAEASAPPRLGLQATSQASSRPSPTAVSSAPLPSALPAREAWE